ncbi:hypothetical protein FOD75_11440 (plasmid) [Limosilactobacillus reuteri]|uniref:Uncharacterized protein n=1 Tax=Limosilactobacillus reuteri TaxID=1598 RepID=A0A517D8N3_LIMRT|nr:hypothetical protein [Limosilactobacillus reuteri]QDR73696.1 hypothetical protein FOD75_11440 [Limosilactobacillus reuteri]
MKLYVLQADVEELDYVNYGVYTTQSKLLDAATVILAEDFQLTEDIQADHGFSGLVYFEVDLDNQPMSMGGYSNGAKDYKHEIYWDSTNVNATNQN